MNLISDVFDLCRTLEKMPVAQEMRELVYDLNFFGEGREVNRSDLGHLARKQNAQFYGYLFIEESREVLADFYKNLPVITAREKELLFAGHAILLFLNDLCITELRSRYSNIASALNPYSQLKPLLNMPCVNISDYINKRDFQATADAFRETPEHKYLTAHPCRSDIKGMSEREALWVVNTINSKITSCDIHSAPKNILDFKAYVNNDSRQYQIFRFFLTVLALREILANINQVLFKAMIGEPFITLNNGNVLQLEKYTKNVVGESLTVLFRPTTIPYDCMGNIVLMDCRMANNYRIHKFCRVEGSNFSFSTKTGTMLFKMREVNESLNPFFNLCSL